MLRGWTCLLQRAQKRKIYFYLLVFGTSFLNQKNLHPHLSYPTKLVANGSSKFTQAYQGGCVRGCTSERTPPPTHTHRTIRKHAPQLGGNSTFQIFKATGSKQAGISESCL